MPKVGTLPTKPKAKPITIDYVGYADTAAPYDIADLRSGEFRFGQLTLINCEETREFIKLLKSVGVKVITE